MKDLLPRFDDQLGPRMPPELMGKTIQQLKALGAEEICSFEYNPATRAVTGNRSNIDVISDADSEESTRKLLQSMDDEDFDSSHFLDNLQANDDPFEDVRTASANRDTRKKKMQRLAMERQHKIDRVATKIVVKALESGVALDGDPVYEELL